MTDRYRYNFIVEILTAVPRRLTSYAGMTAAGQRGLVVGGDYYKSGIVEWPKIEESDSTAPLQIEISLGNALNEYSDLYWNPINFRKPVSVQKVKFTGATWDEAFPPTFTLEPWFEGVTGRAALRGERLVLACNADMGRRGRSPRTASRNVMVNTQPLAAGTKLEILTTTWRYD